MDVLKFFLPSPTGRRVGEEGLAAPSLYFFVWASLQPIADSPKGLIQKNKLSALVPHPALSQRERGIHYHSRKLRPVRCRNRFSKLGSATCASVTIIFCSPARRIAFANKPSIRSA